MGSRRAYAPGYGERIETIWVDLGFESQKAFSQKLGTAESQVSRWVREEAQPRRPHVKAIAALTDAPAEVFRWVTEGGDKPHFAVNRLFTGGSGGGLSVEQARAVAARLRALAAEIDGLVSPSSVERTFERASADLGAASKQGGLADPGRRQAEG
jgi:transcriptional regulator with XRE-family HTH domain